VARALLAAALPVLVLWVIQFTPLAMGRTVAEYAMLGALIWGMLSLLVIVDPVLSLKVTTLKDVASV
jgi:hypothetical protein